MSPGSGPSYFDNGFSDIACPFSGWKQLTGNLYVVSHFQRGCVVRKLKRYQKVPRLYLVKIVLFYIIRDLKSRHEPER